MAHGISQLENRVMEFKKGIKLTSQSVTPNNDSGAASKINAGVTSVSVAAVTNDANDWIVLPSLADVPNGHEITILCNAGTAFEVRTPATSGEKINTAPIVTGKLKRM